MGEYFTIVKATFTQNWGVLVVALLPFIMPNKWVRGVCFGVGKVLSKVLRQKVGKSGEAVERYFQGTVAAAVDGLNAGLDEDDKR